MTESARGALDATAHNFSLTDAGEANIPVSTRTQQCRKMSTVPVGTFKACVTVTGVINV